MFYFHTWAPHASYASAQSNSHHQAECKAAMLTISLQADPLFEKSLVVLMSYNLFPPHRGEDASLSEVFGV